MILSYVVCTLGWCVICNGWTVHGKLERWKPCNEIKKKITTNQKEKKKNNSQRQECGQERKSISSGSLSATRGNEFKLIIRRRTLFGGRRFSTGLFFVCRRNLVKHIYKAELIVDRPEFLREEVSFLSVS